MFKEEERMNLRKLWKDKKGSATFGGGIVGVIIGIMVSLLIAIIVVQNLISSQTQAGWSATANTTWTSLQTNIWTAITLLVIKALVFTKPSNSNNRGSCHHPVVCAPGHVIA